jgi:outer membrane putative beta-barrel porin/alpha-amylase
MEVMMKHAVTLLAVGSAVILIGSPAWAGQPLETESTHMLGKGRFELEAGFEHQRSGDGTETATPLAIEYGITNRLELLVEPVPYNRIHDTRAVSQTGFGDVEVTATMLLREGRKGSPSLALAGEVKVPTAKNLRIGSGETDYSVYVIGGKRSGRWDTQINLGYTVVGAPSGVQVNNMENFAVSEEFQWKERWQLVGEVFGHTAAQSTGEGTATPGVPGTTEIGGAEIVGTVGARYLSIDGLAYSIGLSLDNNAAFLIHPGITLRW